jgi:hypothetical protein
MVLGASKTATAEASLNPRRRGSQKACNVRHAVNTARPHRNAALLVHAAVIAALHALYIPALTWPSYRQIKRSFVFFLMRRNMAAGRNVNAQAEA